MSKISTLPPKAFLLFFVLTVSIHFSFAQQKKIRVLIVTGGHGFVHDFPVPRAVSYLNWPEFLKVVGAQCHTDAVVANGDTLNANYDHGIDIQVKVEDKQHPVTKGISDFDIVDEVYSDVEISWINHYGSSDVIGTEHSCSFVY